MTTGFVRAHGGKSHSWLTPTISRSKPSANKISVADGSSDTIRMTQKCTTLGRPAGRVPFWDFLIEFAAPRHDNRSHDSPPLGNRVGDSYETCARSYVLCNGVLGRSSSSRHGSEIGRASCRERV